MKRLLILLPVFGALFAAAAGSAYAGDGGVRPLEFRGSGTTTLTEFFDSTSRGATRGNLIGRATFETSAVLYGVPPSCALGPEIERPTQIDVGSFTAANGDVLRGTTVQTWCVEPTSPSCPSPDVCFDSSGTYAIEGGTGRFADAAGNGDVIARAVFPSFGPDATGSLSFVDSGTIADVGGA